MGSEAQAMKLPCCPWCAGRTVARGEKGQRVCMGCGSVLGFPSRPKVRAPMRFFETTWYPTSIEGYHTGEDHEGRPRWLLARMGNRRRLWDRKHKRWASGYLVLDARKAMQSVEQIVRPFRQPPQPETMS